MLNNEYAFGNKLLPDNYNTLRKLALKLSYKDFNSITGFGSGIHTRLRKYKNFEKYKIYINKNNQKYLKKNLNEKDLLTLYCHHKDKNKYAKGIYIDNKEFLVVKSALIRKKEAPSIGSNILKIKEKARKHKLLKAYSENYYQLTKTMILSSPSAASQFVLGFSSNGWTCWTDKYGKTLKDIVKS